MKLFLLRIKNELYFWLYFYWARKINPYKEPNRAEFNLYHRKYWELGGIRAIHNNKFSLFDYDEIFISPCSFNEVNCGGFSSGKYLLKIGFVPGMIDDDR